MNRAGYRAALRALWLVLACLSCGGRVGDPTIRRALPATPGLNVVVVSFDALRADRLGVYGYERATSPRIDRFARDAVVFERAYSAAQATPTSFAAAFSGMWPSRVFRSWRFEAPSTLASAFREAGYRTAFLSGSVQLVGERGFGAGFDDYEILVTDAEEDTDADGILDDERLLDRARQWLAYEWREPFLLWIHFFTPHAPYTARAHAESLYRPSTADRFESTTGLVFEVENDEELERVRDLYDGEVRHADRLFAALLDILERQAFLDHTIVVLTADHGEEHLDHGALQHRQLYEEVIRVPLIVRHPRAATGIRTGRLYSNVDLLPTLAALTGARTGGVLDGRSLLDAAEPDRTVLSMAMTGRGEALFGVLRGREKAIIDCTARRAEYYDLAADPAERTDLAASRQRRLAELHARAADLLGEAPCEAMQGAVAGSQGGALAGEIRAKLEALGYLAAVPEVSEPPGGGAPRIGLRAEPNPIPVCDGLPVGSTTISWLLPSGPPEVEVRVDSAGGAVFARGGTAGRASTGRWVRDGMRFVLVDRRDGRALDEIEVRLTSEGCGERVW